jgi:pimeloyl-ACP methyl ester carboxylesterase
MTDITRRALIAGAAGTALLAGCQHGASPVRRNYVLVHGAWHGGWCWRDVKALLEKAGHRVFTPTLPGLDDKPATASNLIGLQDHINAVVGLIRREQLYGVHLVGHSFGGMVVTGVADALKSRVARIVYLDAAVPKNGESMISYGAPRPPEVIAATRKALEALAPDGINMTPLPPEAFAVLPNHPAYAWTKANLRPHPFKTWIDPITLKNGGSDGLKRLYIHCVKPVLPQTQFPYIAAQVRNDPSWSYAELQTGHDAMITDPQGLAALLLGG